KGGGAPDLLAATNACVTGWMGGAALTADSAEWTALEGYLQSISDEAVTAPNALAPEVLADEAAYEAAYAGGDAAAGEAKYNAVCGVCHNSALKVGPTAAYPTAALRGYTAGRIAQKVRTSGPPPSGMNDAADSTPGPMPFFEPDELSSEDLADIIAYLKG
ncbi:MAG: c-type cytochrome, partial [Myxococcales bacterium]|nr:c-type cytochrome [Myxococcales bacterium]